MTGRLGTGCIARMMSSARGCSLAIPQLRSARSAAPFLPQRSLLTAARARQGAAARLVLGHSRLPSLASSARKALSCGLSTADLSRKGTRIVAGSARRSWTTLISAAPPISSAGETRVEKAASALIQAAVCYVEDNVSIHNICRVWCADLTIFSTHNYIIILLMTLLFLF